MAAAVMIKIDKGVDIPASRTTRIIPLINMVPGDSVFLSLGEAVAMMDQGNGPTDAVVGFMDKYPERKFKMTLVEEKAPRKWWQMGTVHTGIRIWRVK
jgi:hypothetical protein